MAPAVGAISPHLDDLALSCGRLLAARPGSSMVTVFAGGPDSVDPVTGWESLSGLFEPGADIVGTRRSEDAEAARMLGCDHRHLGHWDDQYRHRVYGYRGPRGNELVGAIAADLEALITASGLMSWLVPLGIGHPDHEIVAAACLSVAERLADREWLVYEELPYATYGPRHVDAATGRLRDRGFGLESTGGTWPPGSGPGTEGETGAAERRPAKVDVISCYRSQIGPLGEGVTAALDALERVQRLHRLH